MKKHVQRAFQHSVIYGLGNLTSKLIGLILLPLYTDRLTAAQFGTYGLFEILMQLLPVLGLGVPFALQRWIGLKEYADRRGTLIFTSFVFLIFFVPALLVILWPVSLAFHYFYFPGEDYSLVFWLLAGITYFQLLTRNALVIVRMDERSIFFSVSNSIKFLVQLLVIIYAITELQMGFAGIFFGELVATIVLFVILLPYVFRQFVFQFDRKELIEMIRIGLPSLSGNYAVNLLNYSDRNFLTLLGSDVAMGIYLLGYKISNIISTFVITSFNTAFPALAWKEVGGPNENRFFSKMLTYFAFALVWLSLAIVVFSKGIIHTMAQQRSYWDAASVLPLISLGLIFNGLSTMFNFGLLAAKQTHRIPAITLSSVATSVVLNFSLVPVFGIYGTAIASSTTYLVRAFHTWWVTRKHFLIEWEFDKIAILLLTGTGLYAFSLLFDEILFYPRIAVKSLIVLAFPFVLLIFKFFEPVEIETIKKLLAKLRGL
jgi:O-antigen/teichoic acid export membrane protein